MIWSRSIFVAVSTKRSRYPADDTTGTLRLTATLFKVQCKKLRWNLRLGVEFENFTVCQDEVVFPSLEP
jgi:hypothetical protein